MTSQRPAVDARRSLVGALLLLAAVVLPSIIWLRLGPNADLTANGGQLPDQGGWRSAAELLSILEGYGDIGQTAYRYFLAGDTVWIWLVGLGAMLIIRTGAGAVSRRKLLRWSQGAPIVMAVTDSIENLALYRVVESLPTISVALAATIRAATILKWIAALATAILIFGALIALIAAIARPRHTVPHEPVAEA